MNEVLQAEGLVLVAEGKAHVSSLEGAAGRQQREQSSVPSQARSPCKPPKASEKRATGSSTCIQRGIYRARRGVCAVR